MTSEPPGWSAPSEPGWGAPPAPGGPPAWGAPGGWAPAPAPAWGAAPGRPPELRPGVVPLRPLGVGEIIDGAVSTMRRHWKLQLGLSAAVVTAVSVLQAGALWLLYRDPSGIEGGELTGPESTSVAANAAQVITVVIGQLAQMVLLGILVFLVSRAVLGEEVTARQAWDAARPHVWRLVGLSVLILVLVLVVIGLPVLAAVLVAAGGGPTGAAIAVGVVGELAAIPTAVWLWVRFGVATPALVLEKVNIRTALRRSAGLVRRSWWRVCGILLLATVLGSVLGGIISLPFTALAFWLGDFDFDGVEPPGVWFYVFSAIGGAVSGTLTYPFTAGVAALLYIDLRMRREGLDLTLVRAARAAGR